MAITWPKPYNEPDGEEKVEFEGCVIETRERNGYHDSDFYAVVWDSEKQIIREVEYDTTRFAGGGNAGVDVTDKVMDIVGDHCRNKVIEFAEDQMLLDAEEVKVGRTVKIVRGRSGFPKGTIGKVFWLQEVNNDPWNRSWGRAIKIGMALDDEKETITKNGRSYKQYKNVAWTYAHNVEVINPDQYINHDIFKRYAMITDNWQAYYAYRSIIKGVSGRYGYVYLG